MADPELNDDIDPPFLLPDLKHRFKKINADLEDRYHEVSLSESSDSVAELHRALDDLSKWYHDCQHKSRGPVKPTVPETVTWLLQCLENSIDWLESKGLQAKDEYVDLISERNLLRRHLPLAPETHLPLSPEDLRDFPLESGSAALPEPFVVSPGPEHQSPNLSPSDDPPIQCQSDEEDQVTLIPEVVYIRKHIIFQLQS